MDKKIYGYVIKFDDGTYYGGCRKRNRKWQTRKQSIS